MNGGPSFAQQRLVALALILGMAAYAIAVAVLLQQSDGKGFAGEPIALLDDVALFGGLVLGVVAVAVRAVLRQRAAAAPPERRAPLRFLAALVPLAIVEGACVLALTVWLLNGNAVPSLAVAMVLLSLAILITPFTDPGAAS